MVAAKTRSTMTRRGAVMFKVLVCLSVLIGMLALNLDGGRMMDERRSAQNAADAAALAAGAKLYEGYWDCQGQDPDSSARNAALAVAVANGFAPDKVTVNIPPRSGSYAGKASHAEVIIDTSLDASFSRVFSGEPLRVSARSVSRGEPLRIGIICLRDSGPSTFNNTSVALAVVNKPIIVNSDDPVAFRHFGLALVATNVDVTGGVNVTGLLNITRMRTDVRPTLDPLAFLPVPDVAAMPLRSNSPLTLNSLLPVILQPGIYRGGLRVTGATVVLMTPGVYVMEGGGFRVDQLATVTGLGTMVYNTTSPTYAAGPISVTGLGKVVMTAPLSGTYQGLNFFQHRGITQPISVTGLGLTTITGCVYAASAAVNLNGTAAVGLDILGGAYVVDTMNISGVGAVTINLGLNPPRVPDVRLVE